ncbi:Hsp20/alpha crystallin family protein [methanotrophic endosymbiont of Bathymodiolus puteoserpentis (Logatchev)]|uniref:Hsp20/alpha crystallin family protein n=1 Tax=methanotrophic endosymbiont of Bathymodiolus puteoserpentis (Logatchev) TaxID=343235 RepID=UPI0013C7FB97|nr:Hsp20/alpha crystallin family protein [methanotrophic endosymbiont of Bathymodiolus puteoserpentis (Logatchev)]SHE20717.1 Heat shock protein, Hsp20 family [methanotrophic endosymbiont of Bathymodiolus puteoserpentis (Logatchev)]
MNTENKELTTQQNKVEVAALTPATDIYESKEGVVLYVDLPGVSKSALDIDVDQDILSIKGKVDLTTQENMQATYMDVRANIYERRFTLGDELDSSKIDAKLDNGVLKLSIPRLEQHQPKKITIKVA